MKTKYLIIIITLLLTYTHTTQAQLPLVRNFTPADYNSGKQNWGMAQTGDGQMFFANNIGLLGFDGERWATYLVDNYTTVRAVMYDKQRDVIYAGATNEFGYYSHNAATNRLQYHSLSAALPEAERNFDEIWAVHRQADNIVFQSKNNIFIYSSDKKITNIKEKQRIESSAVIAGRLIFARRDGLFEIAGGRPRKLRGTDALHGLTVRAILPADSIILLATSDEGVFAYNGQTTCPYPMDITPILRESQIFCAAINSEYMAFGTVSNGLILKNRKTGNVIYANIYTGMQNSTVLSITFDRQNNIWLGLDNGISYIVADSPHRDLLGRRNSVGTGYASAVYAGRLYLGTNQGLFSMPMPLKSEPRPQRPQPVKGIAGQVWSLRVIGGRLLCGADKGAYVVNGDRSRLIDGTDGTWDFCELKHHPGYIIASDYKGFYTLHDDNKSIAMHSRLDGLVDIQNGSLKEDKDGTIWIGHWQKGIYHAQLNATLTDATITTRYGKNNGLVMDENNITCRMGNDIVISSVDGLYKYDSRSGKLIYDKTASTIFNSYGSPLEIHSMPNNPLLAMKSHFIATASSDGKGGYTVDSTSLRSIADGLHLGLGDIGYLDSKHVILNHDDGFYIVGNNTRRPRPDNLLMIRRITSTTGTDSTLYSAGLTDKPAETVLPHSLNSIRIEFALPEYTGPHNVEYRCMLEGYDKEWSSPVSAPYKEYTKLPHGTYTFRVKAHNRISGRTHEVSTVITVSAAWYETWPAYIIYIVIAATAIAYIVRLMKRRAERELTRVKAQQEQQMREKDIKLQMEREKRKHQMAEMRNEQLNIELKHKQSQLTDSTMNLMRKNDMLQQIDENMHELSESVRRGDAKPKLTKQIQEIRKSIQDNMNDDDNWEKFENNFNMVYDDFMKVLTARFPDLKINDRKLCAYLRMGLSSKEMASLLNMPVRSIETARYRLRKKLNMTGGENLTEFIQNIGES